MVSWGPGYAHIYRPEASASGAIKAAVDIWHGPGDPLVEPFAAALLAEVIAITRR